MLSRTQFFLSTMANFLGEHSQYIYQPTNILILNVKSHIQVGWSQNCCTPGHCSAKNYFAPGVPVPNKVNFPNFAGASD